MTSPYSDFGSRYREAGICVIPCAAGAKFPGKMVGGAWRAMKDWQQYAHRMPTGFETRFWDNWEGAGICAPLGAISGRKGLHLVAVDIDTDYPAEIAAIRAALPGSPVAKRGAKGETQFYLASDKVKSRPYNDAHKRRLLDLLCEGRQTVLPPSIHPDTNAPYVWITPDSLESIDLDDLPVLPDDIADRLAEALAPFGHVPQPLHEGVEVGSGMTVHRELNDAALANLDAWIPHLQLVKCRKVSGGKYKAVAHWRPSSTGRPDSKRATNLAISPDGIKDCGEDKGYTPLDLVMAACGTDLDTAFKWLQDRVAPQQASILKSSHAKCGTVAGDIRFAHDPDPEPVNLWQHYKAPTLPRGVLPGVLESFAFDHGRIMGADPAGLALSAIAVCAAATSDDIKLQVKQHDTGWTESARFWVGLVGDPSTKKTPIMRIAMRPLQRIDDALFQDYSKERSAHARLSKEERALKEPPVLKCYVVEDATSESLQGVLNDNTGGVLSFQDELSGWLGGMDRYSTGKGADRAFYLKAYNGGSYGVSRVQRGHLRIPNLSIGLLGGIQPGPLRKLLGDTMDDGLVQRFLPVILRPADKGMDVPTGPAVDDYNSLVQRLTRMRPPQSGNLAPPLCIKFDEGALDIRERLEAEHSALVRALEQVSPKLAAHYGKADAIFARLCLLWHCIEAEGEVPAPIIDVSVAERVAAFMERFVRPSAVAFYAGMLKLQAGHETLVAVADLIVADGLEEVDLRAAQRSTRELRSLDGEEFRRLCERLESFGWLTPLEPRQKSKTPRWRVVPAVHPMFAEHGKAEKARRTASRNALLGALGV